MSEVELHANGNQSDGAATSGLAGEPGGADCTGLSNATEQANPPVKIGFCLPDQPSLRIHFDLDHWYPIHHSRRPFDSIRTK